MARPAKPSEQEQKVNIKMKDLSNETGNAGDTCTENPPNWRGNMVFCQSCGRPLDKDEDFGTNADSSKNNDYCAFCYTDGKFTRDITMEGMIEICVPVMVKVNREMTAEKARESMRERFPKLKRWKTV